MDFASLMSAQISKTKDAQPDKDQSTKFSKRGELEALREAAYLKEQENREEARREKLDLKRKVEEEELSRKVARDEKRRRLAEESRRRRDDEEKAAEKLRRKRLGLPELQTDSRSGDDVSAKSATVDSISEADLAAKLRELNEPITLFGETHKQRWARYQKLSSPGSGASGVVVTDGPIPTTLKPVAESSMKIDKILPRNDEAREWLFRQLASYFTMILKEWAAAMASRPESVKSSTLGRKAFDSMLRARDDLRPLFQKMEAGDIDDGILEPVLEIVHALQERRYVDANDAYLRLSIGKA
jgi:hypothetical protein